MLAYLFWHQPGAGVRSRDYELRLIRFHEAMADAVTESASFWLTRLPFADDTGYEDWYIIEDWAALGALNDAAVSGQRRLAHDAVAHVAAEGWGAVYRVVRGSPTPPSAARWTSKNTDESYEAFLQREQAATVWKRQMVLGPAPEFCLAGEQIHGRQRVWPS